MSTYVVNSLQIVLGLLLAAVLGYLIGWLIRHRTAARALAAKKAAWDVQAESLRAHGRRLEHLLATETVRRELRDHEVNGLHRQLAERGRGHRAG